MLTFLGKNCYQSRYMFNLWYLEKWNVYILSMTKLMLPEEIVCGLWNFESRLDCSFSGEASWSWRLGQVEVTGGTGEEGVLKVGALDSWKVES